MVAENDLSISDILENLKKKGVSFDVENFSNFIKKGYNSTYNFGFDAVADGYDYKNRGYYNVRGNRYYFNDIKNVLDKSKDYKDLRQLFTTSSTDYLGGVYNKEIIKRFYNVYNGKNLPRKEFTNRFNMILKKIHENNVSRSNSNKHNYFGLLFNKNRYSQLTNTFDKYGGKGVSFNDFQKKVISSDLDVTFDYQKTNKKILNILDKNNVKINVYSGYKVDIPVLRDVYGFKRKNIVDLYDTFEDRLYDKISRQEISTRIKSSLINDLNDPVNNKLKPLFNKFLQGNVYDTSEQVNTKFSRLLQASFDNATQRDFGFKQKLDEFLISQNKYVGKQLRNEFDKVGLVYNRTLEGLSGYFGVKFSNTHTALEDARKLSELAGKFDDVDTFVYGAKNVIRNSLLVDLIRSQNIDNKEKLVKIYSLLSYNRKDIINVNRIISNARNLLSKLPLPLNYIGVGVGLGVAIKLLSDVDENDVIDYYYNQNEQLIEDNIINSNVFKNDYQKQLDLQQEISLYERNNTDKINLISQYNAINRGTNYYKN